MLVWKLSKGADAVIIGPQQLRGVNMGQLLVRGLWKTRKSILGCAPHRMSRMSQIDARVMSTFRRT